MTVKKRTQEGVKSRTSSKISKPTGKTLGKVKGSKIKKSNAKAAKAELDKMNSNPNVFDEVRGLLVNSDNGRKQKNALDIKSLKEDFKKDEEKKVHQKTVNDDLQRQLQLLTGMEL